MVEGLSNENPSPVVNLDLTLEEDEEKIDLTTGLIAASQVLSTNPRDTIKELEKEQEKEDMRAMLIEKGFDLARLEEDVANAVKWEIFNLDAFGIFLRIEVVFCKE